MNIVDLIFFMGILIAIVLAIYGYFLVEICEEISEIHRNSIRIETPESVSPVWTVYVCWAGADAPSLRNDMQCVMNRCKDLSHTVEDLDKKRR